MKKLISLIQLIAILLLASCATVVDINKYQPAASTEAARVRVVTIAGFEGNYSAEARMALESKLKQYQFLNNNLFTVVDRKNIEIILNEQQLQLMLNGIETTSDYSNVIGAQGVYFGNASFSKSDTPYTESFTSCKDNDNKTVCTTYTYNCTARDVSLNFSPSLMDVRTSKVIYSNTFIKDNVSKSCRGNLTSVDAMLAGLMQEAIDSLLIDIAPHTLVISVTLKDQLTGQGYFEYQKLFSDGLALAKDKKLSQACEVWIPLYDNNSSQPALNYNLGVCHEAQGDYEEAEKYFMKAYNIIGDQDPLVNEAIIRAREGIVNMNKIKEQIN